MKIRNFESTDKDAVIQMIAEFRVHLAHLVGRVSKMDTKQAEIELCEIPATAPELDRPDLSLIFGEELRLLARAFAQLPYQQREVLFLHLYSGLRFKAIAELQAESINTVQGRYRYGLDKLRALLNSEVEK